MLKWWAYLHTNGTVQLKRFFSQQDLDEANASPFVQDVVEEPFEASSREEAMKIARKLLGVDKD